jgi:CheY-like chemotaxis protein
LARKRLILIADDFADIRDLYGQFLIQRGFDVILAADGQEAVDKASELQPDVIIMDLMMPRMDGWLATRQLRRIENTKHIPVVILTAQGAAGMPVVIREGCAGFLIKPCEPAAMVAEIDRVLDNLYE